MGKKMGKLEIAENWSNRLRGFEMSTRIIRCFKLNRKKKWKKWKNKRLMKIWVIDVEILRRLTGLQDVSYQRMIVFLKTRRGNSNSVLKKHW